MITKFQQCHTRGGQSIQCRLTKRQIVSRGFTLIETMFSLALMSLILLGAIDLFMASARIASETSATTSASGDGANALQYIIVKGRQAQSAALPGDVNFHPVGGYTSVAINYETSLNTQVVYTAMQLIKPATQASTVYLPSGITAPVSMADRTNSGSYVVFFRGDGPPNGQTWTNPTTNVPSPDPAAGQYLWMYDATAGTYYDICRTVDTSAVDAVQFVQPNTGNGSQEVAIKIVCSAYSYVSGHITNESMNGTNTSTLTGKCVLMRNYSTNNSLSSGSQSLNHAFQHS